MKGKNFLIRCKTFHTFFCFCVRANEVNIPSISTKKEESKFSTKKIVMQVQEQKMKIIEKEEEEEKEDENSEEGEESSEEQEEKEEKFDHVDERLEEILMKRVVIVPGWSSYRPPRRWPPKVRHLP